MARVCSQMMRQGSKFWKLVPETAPTAAVRNYSRSSDHIIRSRVTEVQFQTGNFTEFVLKKSGEYSNSVAVECDLTPRKMSYGELRDRMGRWGAFLQKKGLGKGSVVAVVSPNTVHYPAIFFGTVAIGAVYSGVNPTYLPDEVAYQLKDSNAALVVCFGPLEPVVQKALEMNKQNIPVYSMGPESPSKLPRVEDIMSDSSLGFAQSEKLDGEETAIVLYSSGTTGRPKGTAVSHNAAIANVEMMAHPPFLGSQNELGKEQKSHLALMPMFHAGGLMACCSLTLYMGTRMQNVTMFDPTTFLTLVKEKKVTALSLVPTILNFMLTRPEFNKQNFPHMEHIVCGAAPVPPTTVDMVKQRFGEDLFVQHAYGMTEVLITHMDPTSGLCTGYTGQLLPTVEAKVVDLDSGESLPPNQKGEIYLRSRCRMKYYLNNEEATRNTIDEEGWVHSGDVGEYNQQGFFKVVDRTKELVKVQGHQVSPSEIEDVILQIPEVVSVSVIGVPHDILGEAPRAYVVTSAKISKEKVTEHVKAKCAKIKHLVGGVQFLADLPKNATGKVMRKELVKMAQEEKL